MSLVFGLTPAQAAAGSRFWTSNFHKHGQMLGSVLSQSRVVAVSTAQKLCCYPQQQHEVRCNSCGRLLYVASSAVSLSCGSRFHARNGDLGSSRKMPLAQRTSRHLTSAVPFLLSAVGCCGIPTATNGSAACGEDVTDDD